MGGGTSIRSQPANFARESNPASLLVKILQDYIQYKRLYKDEKEKKKKKKNRHAQKRTRSDLSQGKQQYNQ